MHSTRRRGERGGNAEKMTEDQTIELALRRHEESFELKAAGDLSGAEAACREALALFEEVSGKEHPDSANVLQCLGAILEQQCRYDEAEECGRGAVEVMDRIAHLVEGPEAGLILIQALGVQGTALRQKGMYPAAEAVLKRAIALAEEHPDPEALPIALNNLGIVYKYSGNFDEAVRLYTRGLRLVQERQGEKNAMAATLYHNLGGLEHARGRYADGEAPARRAWEIRRELLGEDHPDALADACAYGGILDGLERHAESRPIYEKALAVYERVFGAEHFEVAATLHNLAGVESAIGEETAAEAHYRRALAIKGKMLGEDHPEWALTANNLAAMTGDRELMARAVAVFEKRLEEGHPLRELSKANLAGL